MSDPPPSDLIEQLQRRIADLELLTIRCAHDLQGPTVTISGFLKKLSANAKAGHWDDFDTDLQRIKSLVNLQRQVLTDLLAVVRSNAPLVRQQIMLGDFVRAAIANLSALINHRQAVIQYAMDLPGVLCDEGALMAVMQNLVENSIHATPAGEFPRVIVRSQQEGGEVVVRVRDYGVGIPVEERERVWEPFVRLRSERTGSGLGLYLVKQLIQQHNGRVWIESPDGPGTVVCFTLPIAVSA